MDIVAQARIEARFLIMKWTSRTDNSFPEAHSVS